MKNDTQTTQPGLTIEERRKIAARLRKLRDDKNGRWGSNSKLAAGIGFSTTIISFICSEKPGAEKKWPKADSLIWLEAARFLHTGGQTRRALPLTAAIDLPVTRLIGGALEWAHKQSDIALIYGLAGAGKTFAAQQYEAKNSGVTMMTAMPTTVTVFSFLQKLAGAVGVPVAAGATRTETAIIQKLRIASDRLLIIDEAHHLPQPVLDEARGIYDALQTKSEFSFGLALLGNRPILSNIRRRMASPQILSRIGRQLRLDETGPENVAAVLSAAGVKNPDKELQAAAVSIAARAGSLRRLVKITRDALVLAANDDEKLTAAHLRSAEWERMAESDRGAES